MVRAILALLAQITFSSSTELVVVPVSVSDSRGRSISGLSREQFRVYDEGQLQSIATFEYGEAPVTVGLIVDRSASMRLKLTGVVSAVASFAESSRKSDELFVVYFNEQVQRVNFANGPFTSDVTALTAALSGVLPYGTTALYDAMMEGLRHVASGEWSRRALIVVSDGGDNASRAQLPDVIAMARRTGAVIYSIGLSMEAGEKGSRDVLRRLSSDSGGLSSFPSMADVGQVFNRISADLRNQYVLGFSPQESGGRSGVRQIRVEVSGRGDGRLTVRSRTSYSANVQKK